MPGRPSTSPVATRREPRVRREHDRPILVVEDNDDDMQLALRALREEDVRYEIALARDGVEASEYLFGTSEHDAGDLPIVVFLVLNLPRVSGLEVLRRIRADR